MPVLPCSGDPHGLESRGQVEIDDYQTTGSKGSVRNEPRSEQGSSPLNLPKDGIKCFKVEVKLELTFRG